MNSVKTDILILGAGIGGFEAYRDIEKALRRMGSNKKITLIDQNGYFTFVPMLHEVVSGSVDPDHCTIPLEHIVQAPHEFFKATINKINPDAKTVETSYGTFAYETCIVALGSGVNYFGIPGSEFTYNARSLGAALALRHKLVELLETGGPEIKVVMVGGGYTGVEVAGQIAEFTKKYCDRHYPHKKVTLTLIESSPTILAVLPPRIQARVTVRLQKMGVVIKPNMHVTKINKASVEFGDGSMLESDLTIWTAGVQNMAPCFLEEKFCLNGRLAVNDFLQVNGFSGLYAVGDIALFKNPGEERPVPQLGETAHRMGSYVARHIIASEKNKTMAPFRFKSLGTLMPIGDWWAVAMLGRIIFFGALAWWIRRTVYLLFMPGLTYKLKIVVDWTLRIFGPRDILTFERKKLAK